MTTIIGTLPNIILDGQLVDAVPVMNDLNYIVQQVNANVPALIPASSNTVQFVSTVGGTGNAITLTPTIPATAYTAPLMYRFQAIADMLTGGATINVSGLGTKPLQTATGGPMTGGEVKNGGIYDIALNTGATTFQLINDAQGSGVVNWTPTVTFGGAGVGVTYSTQIGLFFKMGNLCFYSCDVALSNKGSSTGGVQIQGMPVFALAGSTTNGGFLVGYSNVTVATNQQLGAGVNPSSNAISIFKSTSGSGIANVQDTDCSNTSEFLVSGFFTS